MFGKVSARRVFKHPSDRHGSSASAVGMLRGIEKKSRSAFVAHAGVTVGRPPRLSTLSEAEHIVMALVMARIVMAHIVMAHIVMVHIVMAHIVMARIVMAHIVMAHILMAHILMAHIVMARRGSAP